MTENEKLVARLREGADWPEVCPISASELREAATALTLAQARIRELETALAAADAIRVAQRRYMADRGNEELGKAVGAAVAAFDAIRALTLKQAPDV